jgi:hypothetical protein
MEKPDIEWIDKLFHCMTEFYGSRWTRQFDSGMPENLVKATWQSALHGCTYEQIRSALILLKKAAKHESSLPPHQLEFYRYAKGFSLPVILDVPEKQNFDRDIARRALDEIKYKLSRRSLSI